MTEQKEPDLVYALFSDGNYSKRETQQEAASIPHAELVVVGKYHHTYHGLTNHTPWYHWNIQDLHGHSTTLKRGDFEMVAVDLDDGCTNFFGRNIVICDCRKGKDYKFLSRTWGIEFIQKDVLPRLNRLNELGSWEAYEQLEQKEEKIKELEKRNEILQSKIDSIKTNIRNVLE